VYDTELHRAVRMNHALASRDIVEYSRAVAIDARAELA
jgi:hypothetical protein